MIDRLKEKDIEVIINGDGTVHDAEVAAAALKNSIKINALESITEFNKYIASK